MQLCHISVQEFRTIQSTAGSSQSIDVTHSTVDISQEVNHLLSEIESEEDDQIPSKQPEKKKSSQVYDGINFGINPTSSDEDFAIMDSQSKLKKILNNVVTCFKFNLNLHSNS